MTPVLQRRRTVCARVPVVAAKRDRRLIALVGLIAVGLALGPDPDAASAQGTASPAATPAAGSTQTSEGGQVTIKVTWAGPAGGLVFQVTMDTHAVDLDEYDLNTLAVLRTAQGIEVRPSAWDAPKGGHHRQGALTFPAQGPDGKALLSQDAREITLTIRDVAGVPERTFRWTW